MGLSDRAGKNVRALTITTVPTSRPTNNGPCVGSVPLVAGMRFFAARLPAAASSGMINRKRPTSMVIPPARLYHGEFPLMPPNALPLLAALLLNRYRISANPCGPPLLRFPVAAPNAPFQYPPFEKV